MSNDNVKKFLDFLGKAEGADYNVIVGGSKFSDFSRHPNKVGLVTKEGRSTAAGKYQITGTTYRDFAPKLGISDFSPESQDKIAMAIIEQEGALDDVMNGNFGSAIKKLGGRWASLPSSPYSQPKKSQAWVDSQLGTSTGGDAAPVAGLAPAQPYEAPKGLLTNPEEVVPARGPDQEQMFLGDRRDAAANDGVVNTLNALPTTLSNAFQTENYATNIFQRTMENLSSAGVDENLVLTKELVKEAIDGIPEDHHEYVLDGVSSADIFSRKTKVQEQLKMQQQLAAQGWVGVGAQLTAGMLDLETAAGLFLTATGVGSGAGLAMLGLKAGRVANAVGRGLAVGAVSAASTAALNRYRPLAQTSDIYFAGVAGLAFGGVAGAFARSSSSPDILVDYARQEMKRIQIEEIKDAGLTLTDKGAKVIDPPARDALVDEITLNIRKESDAIIEQFRKNGEEQANMVDGQRIAREESDAADAVVPPIKEEVPLSNRTEFDPRRDFTRDGVSTADRKALSMFKVLAKATKNADPLVSKLAERLRGQVGDDVPLFVMKKKDLYSDEDGGGRAYYDPMKHAIYIAADTPDNIKLHEIAHAVTVYKLDYGMDNPNSAHGALRGELDKLLEVARAEYAKRGKKDHYSDYYLKNIYEFTAGMYSGKSTFTDFMASIKLADDTLLGKMVDIVRKILGLGAGETNALIKGLQLTDSLIDSKLNVTLNSQFKGNGDFSLRAQPVSEFADGKADPDLLPPTKEAMEQAKAGEGFIYGLAYENFFAREWVPQQAKDLFARLAGSTTGYKGHDVVGQSAYDQKTTLAGGWEARLAKAYKPAFNEYAKEKGIKRWERAKAFKAWQTDVVAYVRGAEGDYHPSMTKAGNEARAILRDVVDHLNNPGKFNGADRLGLTQDEILDPDTGVVKLTGELDYNDNYFPRQVLGNKLVAVENKLGGKREFIEKHFSDAFRQANPDAPASVVKNFGKWYVKKVRDAKVDRKFMSAEDMLRGVDKDELKDSLVKQGGLSDRDAEDFLDYIFNRNPAEGRMTRNMKNRSRFDENYVSEVKMPDGSTVRMGYEDFFNTDFVDVLNNYFNRNAGAIALANNVGVRKRADIDKLVMEATEGANLPPARQDKVRKYLTDQFNMLLGIPSEDLTAFNKSLQMIRDANVARLMGKAVFNQMQEFSQIAGTYGLKAALKGVPGLRNFVRSARTGKIDDEMLEMVENMTGGAGAEMLRRNDIDMDDDWVENFGDTATNRRLDQAAHIGKQSANGVLKYTGMTGLMVLQKRTHAIAMINHFVDAATGKRKMGLSKERLAWMGLDEDATEAVLNRLRIHSKGDGKGKSKVDFQKWQDEDAETYSKFVIAFQRESRRVIQENDPASMIPVMGKGWAQTMFQFMNFVTQAWNKSLTFALNHRDRQTMMTVLYGYLMSTMTYTSRTYLDSVGMSAEERKKFLDERLSLKAVVFNSAARTAQASVLPMLFDTFSPVPAFSGAKTTSNATDFIGGNPTAQLFNTVVGGVRKTMRNAASDEYQTTERDVQSYFKMMMFSNVIGVSNVINAVAADYPSSENQE